MVDPDQPYFPFEIIGVDYLSMRLFVRQQNLLGNWHKCFIVSHPFLGVETHFGIMNHVGYRFCANHRTARVGERWCSFKQDKSVLYGRPLRLYPNDCKPKRLEFSVPS